MDVDLKSIVLYLGKKGLSSIAILNDINETLGPNKIGYSTISKYLRSQSFSPKKTPIEKKQEKSLDEKNQIIILHALELFPFLLVREIAKMTNIPKSSVYHILTEQLHYVLKHLRWIPHSLNSSQCFQRVIQSHELLTILRSSKENDYELFYTGDESWFYLSTDYEQIWLPYEEKPPTRPKHTISSEKYMVTIFWNPNGFLIVEAMDDNMKFNSDYFINEILEQISIKTTEDQEKFGQNLILHFDNARPHISKKVKKYLEENNMKRAPQPPYSPDIAPSDFFLFGFVKEKLKGCKFESKQELLSAIGSILEEIPKAVLISVFLDWERRLEQVITSDGSYI